MSRAGVYDSSWVDSCRVGCVFLLMYGSPEESEKEEERIMGIYQAESLEHTHRLKQACSPPLPKHGCSQGWVCVHVLWCVLLHPSPDTALDASSWPRSSHQVESLATPSPAAFLSRLAASPKVSAFLGKKRGFWWLFETCSPIQCHLFTI